ncbi:hypothetical protein D3C75_1274610 [compost metagenome]
MKRVHPAPLHLAAVNGIEIHGDAEARNGSMLYAFFLGMGQPFHALCLPFVNGLPEYA